MKRIVSLLLSAVLLLSPLPACRQRPAAEPGVSAFPGQWPAALDVAKAVLAASGHDGQPGELEYLSAGGGDGGPLAAYIENAYGLDAGTWEDAAVIRAAGASAFELAVLRLEDEGAAVRAATALMNYTFERQGDFAGYAPAEADLAANGGISQDGPYAALFICPDTDGADAAFSAAVQGAPPPSRPGGQDAVKSAKELRDFLVSLSLRTADDIELELLDDSDPEALSAYTKARYGLNRGQWEECAIARGIGDSAFEVAVVRAVGADDAREMGSRLNRYLDAKEKSFEASDDQAGLLRQALAAELGDTYVVLLACQDAEGTAQAFAEALGYSGYAYSQRHPAWGDGDPDHPGRTTFTPPNNDDMSLYDTSAIREAWEHGSPSGLSAYDKDIYDAAKKVLDEVLKDGMGDLEKEAAVYGWIVSNVNYDWSHQDIMAVTPRESFTPYGGLVKRKAVCLGYATTLQLLLDLAGVECITVVGAAFQSQEDHGWNMVRLDGNWYCLDVTWDANYREQGVARPGEWDYFNVTSEEMADSNHQWDYANTPEAVTGGNGRT